MNYIRHKELFNDSPHYDRKHADEFKPENTPMLMFMNDEPVATVRLDKFKNNMIIVRHL